MKQTEKALKKAEDQIQKLLINSTAVIIKGLDDSNKYFRYKCAETLLKVIIPLLEKQQVAKIKAGKESK